MGNPSILLDQQRVTGEQRSCVSIRAETKQDKVEDREPRRILRCKLEDQLLLVGVGEFFGVIEEGWINVMDVPERYGDFREEDIRAEFVIGVFVVERYKPFVGVVDMPINPLSI